MKSYFRFLWKYKFLSVIQILGISIALSFAIPAASLLVELQQMKRDNPEYKDIYGVRSLSTMSFEDEDRYFLDTYPEVEKATMFISSGTGMKQNMLVDGTMFSVRTMFANEEITDFFPLRMESGSFESIAEANSIILSKEFASNLAGDNLVGSTVFIGDRPYVVKGILDGFESRRIPDTDIILNLRESFNHELSFWTYTFLKLRDGVDTDAFARKVLDNDKDLLCDKLGVRDSKYLRLGFTPYEDMVINSDYDWLNCLQPSILIILGGAILLLLLFAFSNYTNLSMAMASRRAKEMATKQLLGSSKADIWKQMISENVVFTAICFILGLLLATVSVRLLNGLLVLANKTGLLETIQFTPSACIAYLLLILLIGTLTGIAPTRIILRHSALDVVKGEFKAREKGFMSKVLIVVQGLVTVALVFASIVEMAQLRHNSRMDFGCGIDDTCTVYLSNSDDAEKGLIFHTLSEKAYTASIGYATDIPGSLFNTCRTDDLDINVLICDQGAFEAFGFRVKEDYVARGQSTLWISEALEERLGEAGLDGEDMDRLGADVIGGTIETFIANSHSIDMFGPAAVEVRSGDRDLEKDFIVLKTIGNHDKVLNDLRETVDNVVYSNSGRLKNSRCTYIHDYFYDVNFRELDSVLGLMEKYLVVMILLSVLGILGISTYNLQIRKHDIAIRKIFGSSTLKEAVGNTTGYSELMLVANAIGLPLGYVLATAMLQSEVSKVAIAPWMFIVTILFTMAVVVCLCLIQSCLTISVNPADSIKSD